MRHLLEDPTNTPTAIEQLRKGGDTLFVKVYQLYRKEFISWGKNHSPLNEQDLEDAFQDAVIVLFKKLDTIHLSGSIVGFLWKAFKFKLLHKYRYHSKIKPDQEINDTLLRDGDDRIYQMANNDHLKHLFSKGFQELGEPCRSILKLRFYDNFEGESIAEALGYKNASVVHTKTFTCLKRLRELVADKV